MSSSFKQVSRTTDQVEGTFGCVDAVLAIELQRSKIEIAWHWREVSVSRCYSRTRRRGRVVDAIVWYRLKGWTSQGEGVIGLVRFMSYTDYSGGESFDDLYQCGPYATHVSLAISPSGGFGIPDSIARTYAKYRLDTLNPWESPEWYRCKQ